MSFYSPQPSVDGKKIFVVGEQPRSGLVCYDAKFDVKRFLCLPAILRPIYPDEE